MQPMASGSSSHTKVERRECATCGREFDDQVVVTPLLPLPLRHRDCPECRRAKLEAERRREFEAKAQARKAARDAFPLKAQMPRHLWGKTFDNFFGQTSAAKVVREFAEGFPIKRPFDYRSLMLYSKTNGLGKTHLAGAIANRIFDRWEEEECPGMACPVLYHTGPNLLLRVRSTYHIRPDEAPWRETEAELYASLRAVSLLIVDDVGKEAGQVASEHTQRVYFHIIDDRYSAGLPVVMCSNLRPEELEDFLGPRVGPAVVDRLVQMTQGQVIELEGESYRRKGRHGG